MTATDYSRIAYDAVLCRPGCAILQAVYGCDPKIASEFNTDRWLTAPTPDLKVYPLGPGMLSKLVHITETRTASYPTGGSS